MRNHRVPAGVGALALTMGASVIPAAAIAGKQASEAKVRRA
jgi:hypothetical protein